VIAVDDVLSRLDGVRATRRGWSARCPGPGHRDQHPSLSVARGHNGRALLKCFAGCRYDEIIRALDLEPGSPNLGIKTATRPRSTFAIALDIARRQAWYGEEIRLLYAISDAIRRRRRAVLVARAIAALAGDRPEAWRLLATAATVEREADRIEAELDEIMRIGWRYQRARKAG
jgi:hypothetical protein